MSDDLFWPRCDRGTSPEVARRPWFRLERGLSALFLSLSFACGVGCTGSGGGSGPDAKAPGFNLAASPSSLEVPAGGSGYALVSVTRVNGFTGDITLSMDGLPRGVIVGGTIPDGAPSGRMLIAVGAEVAPAPLGTLTLHGQAGTLHRTTPFALTIAAPLPASQLSVDLVNASGLKQGDGTTENTCMTMEPAAHTLASDGSGAVEARHGFLPVPSPHVP